MLQQLFDNRMSGLVKNKTIECYQLIQEIGKGAYGKVYKGINLNNGVFVALKEIPISKEYIRTIKKEINVLKNLNHKNIVKYEDAVVKDHKIYLILQYIEGGSLSTLCKRSIFPQSLIKLYVHQILEGLEYLHKLNIVHRDIKGLNLLLTKDGKLKIADFGVAVNISENQKTLSAGGSPYWMAPQTIKGQEVINPKIDIWSLGCTVIELMTGTPPYFELGALPALFRIAQDLHPPLPKGASPQLVDFLLRCFQKDPQKRAKAGQLLQHKWMKSINEQQISLQRSHKNIRSSNMLMIESTLKSGNLNEINSIIQKTDNKKLIYYSKNVLIFNEIENSDLKLEAIYALIGSDFSAYKYMESIGIIKNLFTRECKQIRINPLKALQMVRECYHLGLENDLFYMIQNNVVFYIAMLCKQYLTKKQTFISLLPVLELTCSLIKSFCHDQLVLAPHIFQIMQEEDTLTSLSMCFRWASQFKKEQIACNILKTFNKYCQQSFQLNEGLSIFQYSLKEICNIGLFQNDIKTGQENLKLILFLSKYDQFQQRMEEVGLAVNLADYAKLLVLNKNVCEDYVDSVTLYLELMLEFFYQKKDRVKCFTKAGGVKRLKSLPKFLLQTQQTSHKINLIINTFNSY